MELWQEIWNNIHPNDKISFWENQAFIIENHKDKKTFIKRLKDNVSINPDGYLENEISVESEEIEYRPGKFTRNMETFLNEKPFEL